MGFRWPDVQVGDVIYSDDHNDTPFKPDVIRLALEVGTEGGAVWIKWMDLYTGQINRFKYSRTRNLIRWRLLRGDDVR